MCHHPIGALLVDPSPCWHCRVPKEQGPTPPQEPGSLALAQAEILVPLLVQDVFGAASLRLCAPALLGVRVGQTDGSE